MNKIVTICTLISVLILGCKKQEMNKQTETPKNKVVVYQVFTRLFGNTNTTNKPWGTIEENGVGKFNDFTDKALQEIKNLGVTHIWYTGVPHHAVIKDYTAFGIENDDPDVVKGRAGSPYAVKDYYNVNPDLAVDPAKRLEEFENLVKRTHENGLKVIIDIVPNHVARNYKSLSLPNGVKDIGFSDDTTVVYKKDNNFYYIPGERFRVPIWENGYLPLNGEPHPLANGKFDESPAKWTGNGSRSAQPGFYDWYETVKINYGVRPDGTFDFDTLPEDFKQKDHAEHYAFWKDKVVPNSWIKFRDIALYWLDKGVDGFRYDMAEMVPVEFWSYMNSAIKTKNPDAFLLAEVYNPGLYRNYIHKGKMDYLYDKVELYDTLKNIMQGHGSTDNIDPILQGLADIEHHMLHFLENHDEQRIASPGFAGNAKKGKPAMVVSATVSTSPTMLYFAQDLGEPGAENAGFGSATRTSIFDYIGVPSLQRWNNNGLFDGGQSTEQELKLHDFYKRLMNFTLQSKALMGEYKEIHSYNRHHTSFYNDKLFSYVRWSDNEKLIIVANFSELPNSVNLKLPPEIIEKWKLKAGTYELKDQLSSRKFDMTVDSVGKTELDIPALGSFILAL